MFLVENWRCSANTISHTHIYKAPECCPHGYFAWPTWKELSYHWPLFPEEWGKADLLSPYAQVPCPFSSRNWYHGSILSLISDLSPATSSRLLVKDVFPFRRPDWSWENVWKFPVEWWLAPFHHNTHLSLGAEQLASGGASLSPSSYLLTFKEVESQNAKHSKPKFYLTDMEPSMKLFHSARLPHPCGSKAGEWTELVLMWAHDRYRLTTTSSFLMVSPMWPQLPLYAALSLLLTKAILFLLGNEKRNRWLPHIYDKITLTICLSLLSTQQLPHVNFFGCLPG